MLHIQKFLSQVNDIALANHLLKTQLKLNIKKQLLSVEDGKEKYVYIYNYNDDSVFENPITTECKGLILDSTGNIVSMGFGRFRDYNERINNILWKDATATELLDGKLVIVYKYDNKMYVQSRYSVDGRENFNFFPLSSAVERLLERKFGASYTSFFINDKSFIFEFMPESYTTGEEEAMYLLGIVNNSNNTYMNDKMLSILASTYRFTLPKKFDLDSKEAAYKVLRELPKNRKGLLIKDATGKVVRMLKPSYVDPEQSRNVLGFVADAVLNKRWRKIIDYHPKYIRLIMLFTKTIKVSRRAYEPLWKEYTKLPKDKRSRTGEPFDNILHNMASNLIVDFDTGLKLSGSSLLLKLANKFFPKEYEHAIKELRNVNRNSINA